MNATDRYINTTDRYINAKDLLQLDTTRQQDFLYNTVGDIWAMAKNGRTRCFCGQKRMYLKTIAAESVVGRI